MALQRVSAGTVVQMAVMRRRRVTVELWPVQPGQPQHGLCADSPHITTVAAGLSSKPRPGCPKMRQRLASDSHRTWIAGFVPAACRCGAEIEGAINRRHSRGGVHRLIFMRKYSGVIKAPATGLF
jgi:hypothetical protein